MKDPKRAKQIFREALALSNPPDEEDRLAAAHAAIGEFAMRMGDEGKDISSLPEGEAIDALEARGLDPDEIMMVMEDLAAWGVTDEG